MSQAGRYFIENVETLTGNSGGAVAPDSNGNINIEGDGTIVNVVGNPGTNTLTISVDDSVATSYHTDDGNDAIPVANVLNIYGTGLATTTSAGNTVTINVPTSDFTWSVITVGQVAVAQEGYFTNDAAVVAVQLPATSAVGDTFQIAALSSGGWQVSQGVGQQIIIGTNATTIGLGGYLASSNIGDWITLVCCVANTKWMACVEQGGSIIVV